MRPLREYTLADWGRLRPVLHHLKSRRYRRITERHVGLPPRAGDLDAARTAIRGRNAMITIGFNDAQAIDWQIRLVGRFVAGVLVVADNSIDDAAARRIADVCALHGVPYVRLPAVDWARGTSSRSHGLALNWTWRNLVRPAGPSAFGFLDDDMFPTAKDDPFAPLAHQPFYGFIREAGTRWFLWAGFCFFRFDAVRDLPLDFGQDWFKGLDTGGGNWDVLYARHGRAKLLAPEMTVRPYREGAKEPEGLFQIFGDWIHEVGSGADAVLAGEKRAALGETLAEALRETAGN